MSTSFMCRRSTIPNPNVSETQRKQTAGADWTSDADKLALHVGRTPTYPEEPPDITIECIGGDLTEDDLAHLEDALKQEVCSLHSFPYLFSSEFDIA